MPYFSKTSCAKYSGVLVVIIIVGSFPLKTKRVDALQNSLPRHQFVYLLFQFREVFAEDSPYDYIIHFVITMYYKVAQINNPTCIIYFDCTVQF